ncbi:hypothetical protein NFI96_023065, partial [Prochilodus magdalenae]
QPKVAFSATLSNLQSGYKFIGPFQEAVTLVYENAFTNVGSAYNSQTGIFTAPLRGVYYFTFTLFHPVSPAPQFSTAASLVKNGTLVVAATDNAPEQPKVAFSASLSDLNISSKNIGPYLEQVTLVYQHAFTNIGSAYDPNTGIFTAPVRGVYYFSFVAFNPYDHSTGLSLMKNGQHVVSVSDNAPGVDTEDTASNAASLLLEKGD